MLKGTTLMSASDPNIGHLRGGLVAKKDTYYKQVTR